MSNLKAIRGELGVTQQALAKKVGVSQSAVNHYENGFNHRSASFT